MSLFGTLMGFGDVDEDPFFGGTMRHMMNSHLNMMNSFFGGGSPFAMLEAPPGMMPPNNRMMAGGRRMRDDFGMSLMPMGFPNVRNVFDDMAGGANCHSYSQSTVMTMTSGPDGRPQVYQASSSMRHAPGGLKETRKTVADSRTGVKKMQIGHHIGERGHVVEREKNFHSGEAEERQEFINLEEDDADDFDREWHTKIGGRSNAIGYSDRRRQHHPLPQLALPSSSGHTSSSKGPEMKKKRPHEYDSENSQNYRKKNFKKNSCRVSEPIPVVEEPDSDDDHRPGHHHQPNKSHRTTIIEELE